MWATQAPGSIGRTGSVRGIVKYPFGFGSQHFATTSLMGLNKLKDDNSSEPEP